MNYPIIEDVERTFPKGVIPKLFTIFNDATINLINLFKATVFHNNRQDFAADSAGAVSNNGLFFQVNFKASIWHLGN